jgi:excinuclease ABC subunit A
MKNWKSRSKRLKWSNTTTIKGAAEHNLKSLDVEIPHHTLTVVTGVSGSGKSSLVFDTLYREGERRYLESFSSYARQYLGKLTRPNVSHIDGLPPAIAVDQKRVVRNPRSTVGTLTELYDHLRLLFARLGKSKEKNKDKPQRRLFSFNTPYGACPACKGLGVRDRIHPDLLIENPAKTLRQGAMVITTPSGYIIYSQVTMDVLNRVCNAHGFSVDIPWKDLTQDQKQIVLYGSDIIKIPYGKHPLESRLKWSGITARPREEGYYKGILPVMENILKVSRNKNILRFARSLPCGGCGGTRLKPEALEVTFRDRHIAHWAAQTIDRLENRFRELDFSPAEAPVGEPLRQAILQRTQRLRKLGLGYLALDRESTTLSNGEAQRIRLSTQLGAGLRGILYTLDEPSIGLHHRDNRLLLDMLRELRDNGNTVVMVEHDEDAIRAADRLIDIGPAAGNLGGEILFNGPTAELLKEDAATVYPALEKSRTHAYLTGVETIAVPAVRRPVQLDRLTVRDAVHHNLKHIDVSFGLRVLNVVTGVSGAGKSTLVHDILANALKNRLHGANTQPGAHGSIEGIEHIDKVIEIDQAPIGRTPRSNPATYTKVFDHIRGLFADRPESKRRKWPQGRFSFNVKGGRCEDCEGAGVIRIGMHFLGDVDVRCGQCGGKRFNEDTLEILYNNKTIFDVLEMPIDEALPFFRDHPNIKRILQAMQDLGLGYIALGQAATTLSGGEAQRIKLAAELCKPATGKTLYILDEPTTGLHAADIHILLDSLNRLVEKGNTVILVEHHPDVIKTADWLIDLGPDGGENGGELVAAGTPEDAAQCQRSHTAALLREIFAGTSKKPPAAPLTAPPPKIKAEEPVRLNGVYTHNLKGIDVEIPVNKMTVITGVSGSGKSSLAFDTLFAEGQQRYLTRYSTYARRLLANTAGTARDMESCSGLLPTIAVSQAGMARNPRSTVGTMTEILDYYRLLFARAGARQDTSPGSREHQPLFAAMFSFNHHQGACPHCKGLGVVTVCDPAKLVTNPDRSLMDGALDGSKTGKFYGDPFGQYIAILKTAGEKAGIDYSRPWNQLQEDARCIAMYGAGQKQYDVTWRFKRKNRRGEHRFKTPWTGFANYVNEEYGRKHADKRGHAMLPLMTDQQCPACRGGRLKKEYLAVRFAGLNIAELCAKTVTGTLDFFHRLEQNPDSSKLTPQQLRVSRPLRQEILRRLGFLRDTGLDYLNLDRNSDSLSGGEAQRIRLAGQLGSGLTGVIYVLDEPTIGLHGRDTGRLLSVLRHLRDTGNTVVIVEHDADMIHAADYIIDLGPSGGKDGGSIIARGAPADIRANPASKTGKYLLKPDAIDIPGMRSRLNKGISITNAYANNLKNLDIEIPSGGIIAVTGVSGCGKSTLLFDVIAASDTQKKPSGCQTITGLQHFEKIITVDQTAVSTSPTSTPATYTGIFDFIRDRFAATPTARKRGYKKNRFSFNVKGGRCETCQGSGEIRTSMDFLSDVRTTCEDCKGSRYNKETLECLLNGKSIAAVLDMTISEALLFFKELPPFKKQDIITHTLHTMEETGLGYIQLGQPANTLSGGEAQRLKLTSHLATKKTNKIKKTGQNLFLLDEPTTGLHFEDVERLLKLFHHLADTGHTLLVIEHHRDIIKHADHIIDLGPEGGDNGGQIIATGTPADIAANKTSHTGCLIA